MLQLACIRSDRCIEEVRREDLPASLTRDYYACKEQVYREISGNSRDPQSIRRYEDKSFVYRDSLAMMVAGRCRQAG